MCRVTASTLLSIIFRSLRNTWEILGWSLFRRVEQMMFLIRLFGINFVHSCCSFRENPTLRPTHAVHPPTRKQLPVSICDQPMNIPLESVRHFIRQVQELRVVVRDVYELRCCFVTGVDPWHSRLESMLAYFLHYKLRGLSPWANYTDRTATASLRS
jgi:hypothetical protein